MNDIISVNINNSQISFLNKFSQQFNSKQNFSLSKEQFASFQQFDMSQTQKHLINEYMFDSFLSVSDKKESQTILPLFNYQLQNNQSMNNNELQNKKMSMPEIKAKNEEIEKMINQKLNLFQKKPSQLVIVKQYMQQNQNQKNMQKVQNKEINKIEKNQIKQPINKKILNNYSYQKLDGQKKIVVYLSIPIIKVTHQK